MIVPLFRFFFLEQREANCTKCIALIIGQLLQRVCQPVVFFLQRSICLKKNSKNLIILLKLGRVTNYLIALYESNRTLFQIPY